MKYIRLPLHAQKWVSFGGSTFVIFIISFGISAFGVTRKDVWLLLFLLGCFVVSIVRFLRSGDGEAELIINTRGIQLNHPRYGEKEIDWPRIQLAICSGVTGNLKIVDCEDRTILVLRQRDLGGHILARDCAKYTNERLREYRTQ